MIDPRHEESACLYVLDLLEGAELAEFEAALARDPALGQHVRELREAAAALAHTPRPAVPPPEVKQCILSRCSRASTPPASAPNRILSFPALIPWALAACLALCAAWTGSLYLTARSENAMLRDSQRLADLELRSARTQFDSERIVDQREIAETRQQLADAAKDLSNSSRQVADLNQKLKVEADMAQYKITTLDSTPDHAPQAVAVVVWCPSMQEGVLAVKKLPDLPAGKDYQLWVIDPAKGPVDAGVFAIDAATGEAHVTFKTRQPIKSIAKFAVSMEQKGGSPTPHDVVLLSSSDSL